MPIISLMMSLDKYLLDSNHCCMSRYSSLQSSNKWYNLPFISSWSLMASHCCISKHSSLWSSNNWNKLPSISSWPLMANPCLNKNLKEDSYTINILRCNCWLFFSCLLSWASICQFFSFALSSSNTVRAWVGMLFESLVYLLPIIKTTEGLVLYNTLASLHWSPYNILKYALDHDMLLVQTAMNNYTNSHT